MPSETTEQKLSAALLTQPVDFKMTDFPKLVDEVEQGLDKLVDALGVVQKFARFLPGDVGTTLGTAVRVLTGLRDALAKLP